MTVGPASGPAGSVRTIDDLTELAVAVADRRSESAIALVRLVFPSAVRYARARLGASQGRFDLADRVANECVRSIVFAAQAYHDRGTPFAVIAYGICRRALDTAERSSVTVSGGDSVVTSLAPAEREVLVLRVAVQLSVADTSLVLQIAPERVRILQHLALSRLRDRQVRS